MKNFVAKTFDIGDLSLISKKNIEEHLKLYNGYVNNANLILSKIKDYESDKDGNAYIISELHRRFSFEVGGVRNHENYFTCLSGGKNDIDENSSLAKKIREEWGSIESFVDEFKRLALTRGIGWVILYYDTETDSLVNHWVDEQHLGHLVGFKPVLCLDMWEHAFVYDFPTSEKKKYIDAFFENLNWENVSKIFESIIGK